MEMNRQFTLCTSLLVAVILFASSAVAEDAPANDPIAWVRRDKIRMGWTPETFEQYQMMKDAGMNAVMPRLELDVPTDDAAHPYDQALSKRDEQIMSDLKQGSALAKKLGLRYFHCLNFAAESQTYDAGLRDDPARCNDGKLPSPIDPVFWKRTIIDRVNRALKLLSDQNKYALDGVIIDPEMYALSGGLPGDPDYGKYAFERFLKQTNRPAPADAVDVASRKKWLESQKLDAEYVKWQADIIRGFGQELRTLVSKYRPNAIIGYVIYEDRMWFNAIAAGMTTPRIPVLVCPESTYSGVMDQTMIDYFAQMRKSIGVPCLLLPGVDMEVVNSTEDVPTERLAVLVGNVYQRCQYSEGYWVFAIYRFGSTTEKQSAFFNVIKKIDDALDAQAKTGKVDASLAAAPLPFVLPKGFKETLASAKTMHPVAADVPKASFEFQTPLIRGAYGLLLWPDKGERQSVTIAAVKLGNYLDVCNTQLFSSAGSLMQENPVELNNSRVIWIPESAGTPCAMLITAGANRWMIQQVTGKAMLVADDILAVNAGNAPAGRFYFYVPKAKKTFGVSLLGDPGETADYSLFDSAGKKVRSWEKLTKNTRESIPVTQSGVWCIQVDQLVDDGGFGLTDLPNLFALRPQDVMIAGD